MIRFTALIAAIQQAVDSAGQAVTQQNINLFKTYFTKKPPARGVIDDTEVLVPKMVTMEYKQGQTTQNVEVPLISMAPFTCLQPSEMCLEIDLECSEKEGEIFIAFPQEKKSLFGNKEGQDAKPNARLTIKINATTRPAGIEAVINGYDKTLRAAIPEVRSP